MFTLDELIDGRVKVNAAAREALLKFKRAKPWRGDEQERAEKFAELHCGMVEAYGLKTHLVGDDRYPGTGCSGGSEFEPVSDRIILRGRLSVVTYLHLLCYARGKRRREAMRWSLSVFKRFFPISFARCRFEGGMLRR